MAIEDLRGLATVLCMLAFISVVWWAYGPSRKKRFETASQIPFVDSESSGQQKAVSQEKDNDDE